MKFDAVIIGGGLAGLICGIKLGEAGLRCAIVSRGQSALHFSSGSLDLLSHLADGTPVEDIESGLCELISQSPLHPYARVGASRVLDYADQTEALLARAGLTLQGHWRYAHSRLTPLGQWRKAWLSQQDAPCAPLSGKRIRVVGIAGFLDFEPLMVAEGLKRQGIEADTAELALPALDALRQNPSEFRSVNIARMLDDPRFTPKLLQELTTLASGYDTLLLPAVIGLEQPELPAQLQQALPCALNFIPTLPPSVPGMRTHNALTRYFRQTGGIIMEGDAVTSVTLNDLALHHISTRNHGDIPLKARHVVLASGSFFSNGLIAGRQQVREAIPDLDLQPYNTEGDWSHPDFFHSQPWQFIGVNTNDQLQPSRHGQTLAGLYAIGTVLGGFDPVTQGCGGGVCAVTALHAAHHILSTGSRL